MNVAAWVQRNGLAFADRPGISVGTHVHATYAQWAARVQSIGGSLKTSFTTAKMSTNPASLPYHPGALRYYKEKGLVK